MQSNGGLTDARAFRGKDAILSGPAGGVVGMARTAAQAGFDRVIGFDMGGTSTDVCHYAGAYERAFETVVAGVRMRAPMMNIHTVAAGGGSICSFDGARLRVGPASAGAVPGPAAYRRGGPLTVTDCNVRLGKLRPEFFPAVFGPNADQPLDALAVTRGFDALAADILTATGEAMSPEAIAEGFLTIAVENMAKAVRQISIQRGYDVTRYVLACFGGAGGQHACLVADALGMTKVMIHPFAGVLSAYGMGLADLRLIREATVEQTLEEATDLAEQARVLSVEAEALLRAQAVPLVSIETLATLRVKYAGTDTPLVVPLANEAGVRAAFEEMHQRRFGFTSPTTALVVETLSVEAIGHSDAGGAPDFGSGAVGDPLPLTTVDVRMAGKVRATPVFDRETLAVGAEIKGPAIIREATG
ncbi:MAG TPA: hydantoinase/oxoprolinase family protein, partial [Caulobacter sp.]|nr:hydantoinase/oxoprolinase family protein [Caulobacter sp.]